jgi:sugar phosphate permease
MGLKELQRQTPDGALRGPATWVRYQVLGAGCLFALICYVHRVGFASAGTYFDGPLTFSDWDWGVIMFAFQMGYALFEVPWGLFGDRLGGRHLLTLMCLGWSVLTAAVALLGLLPGGTRDYLPLLPLLLLLLLRFLFGVFQAGAFPGLARTVADWMPIRERATAQGSVWMFSRIGGALAPFLIVGLIEGADLTWEATLVLVSGLGLLWCAGFWPWYRNRPEEMPKVNDAELARIAAGRSARDAHAHLHWTALFRSRSVWALCLMYGCGAFSATFFITLLPKYLRTHRHLSAEEMQWLSGLPLLCGVAGCLLGGLISDWLIHRTANRKWGRRVTGLFGATGAGFALLATNWTEDVGLLALLLCVTFFCNDLAMGPAWAACADIGERYAGTLGGTMNMIGNLGAGLGTLVAGRLLGQVFDIALPGPGGWTEFEVIGNQLVFVVFACSFWLGALCWFGVDVTRPLSADLGRQQD